MRTTLALTLLLGTVLSAAAEGAADKATPLTGSEIQLSITAPPQSLYVIGEPIPIEWKFTNTTAEPLGMFWESCCFTYGEIVAEDANHERLERKRPPPPPNAPPGWLPDPKAALSWHAFPMVTRIEPHASVSFQTVLDNWLVLSRSGKFKLTAKYTGAPDSALKQRGPKLRLWNGKAEAQAFELELLTPRDYLARPPISDDVMLTLTARTYTFSPGTEPFPLSISVKRANDKPLMLHGHLWVLDPNGTRIRSSGAMAAEAVEGPGGRGTRIVTTVVAPDALIGEPLAQGYSAFVEVVNDANPSERWVSKAVTFNYELDRPSMISLIRDAASKPEIRGERGPSMRMLRAYLGDLHPLLDSGGVRDEFSSDAERRLFDDLRLAAVLKSSTDVNQRVVVKITESKPGQWSFSDSRIHAVANWNDPMAPDAAANDCALLNGLRNQLGGEVAFEIVPTGQTHVGALRTLGKALFNAGILDSTRVRLTPSMCIHLTKDPAPNVIIAGNVEHLFDFQIKTHDPNAPNRIPRFSHDEIKAFETAERKYGDPAAFRSSVLKVYPAADVRVLLVLADAETLDPFLPVSLDGFGDVELGL